MFLFTFCGKFKIQGVCVWLEAFWVMYVCLFNVQGTNRQSSVQSFKILEQQFHQEEEEEEEFYMLQPANKSDRINVTCT